MVIYILLFLNQIYHLKNIFAQRLLPPLWKQKKRSSNGSSSKRFFLGGGTFLSSMNCEEIWGLRKVSYPKEYQSHVTGSLTGLDDKDLEKGGEVRGGVYFKIKRNEVLSAELCCRTVKEDFEHRWRWVQQRASTWYQKPPPLFWKEGRTKQVYLEFAYIIQSFPSMSSPLLTRSLLTPKNICFQLESACKKTTCQQRECFPSPSGGLTDRF